MGHNYYNLNDFDYNNINNQNNDNYQGGCRKCWVVGDLPALRSSFVVPDGKGAWMCDQHLMIINYDRQKNLPWLPWFLLIVASSGLPDSSKVPQRCQLWRGSTQRHCQKPREVLDAGALDQFHKTLISCSRPPRSCWPRAWGRRRSWRCWWRRRASSTPSITSTRGRPPLPRWGI